MALLASLLALRGDARIQKVPPYLSAFCIFVGIAWLLVLPLNEYSRRTYVSENALLPGQVHTYFQGSEHNIFRAYRHEVHQLIDKPVAERSHKLEAIFKEQNLKFATQKYNYTVSNRTIANENVYAILQGPRADATEAIVLVGAWKNMKDEVNNSGVALILTLARYFKRWSLWSKDIIFLVPGDSTVGPQAWVDAYHDGHDTRYVEDLKIKSGALQGAIAVDYPAGPWGHRYDKLHVVYDGINGQLPNLDLFNTAVQVASNQMGISSAIHGMFDHKDTYQDRLETLFRGMLTQGLGHATGPHSSFIPYHVDAITLVTVGDGWHDEISLGKTVESLVRSLNNLLEHLHQSFFFYLLLQANRFVSIGTYLPSAMLIAFNFSITAIALWVKSGQSTEPAANPASTAPPKAAPQNTSSSTSDDKKDDSAPKDTPPVTLVTTGTSAAIVPTTLTQTVSRPLLRPTLILLTLHLISLIPLYMFNTHDASHLIRLFFTALNMTTILPFFFAFLLTFTDNSLSAAETTLLQSLSLLLLGVFLAVLATLNFSLAVIIGLLCTPLSFVRKSENMGASILQGAVLLGLNPLIVMKVATWALGVDIEVVLKTAAVGWSVWGLWTQVIVWVVWWPAWVVASFVVASGAMD